MTPAELLDRPDVLLGGRVAEELVFGDISTGAQDDLQRATDMARHMVTRYGMNEALGLATIDGTLRTSAWRGASYSRWAIVGLYWSNVYEHLAWKRIRRATSASPVAARIGSAR